MIRELTEAGKFKAVIDCCYRLEQIVEAHHYAESGQRTGHVVIRSDAPWMKTAMDTE